jgi:acyl-CoA thioesterase-2
MEERGPVDVDQEVAETLRFLAVRPHPQRDGDLIGDPPEWFGPVLFGGFVIAQAIMAATHDAPAGRRLHSMHCYFLRPALSGVPIDYRVEPVRDGRSFTSRHLAASQDGKAMLDMTCSFTADTDGYDYDQLPRNPVPPPAELAEGLGPGAWVARDVGPTEPGPTGSRDSTDRKWFRVPARLPDDERLHAALLGFATDWTGIGGRPLHLQDDTTGMVSLDHAVWFHRLARADQWLFYDVESIVNAGGRGLLRGVMRDEDGHVVISMAQEMRLTVIDS